jgi:hypothetical protein
MWRIAYHALPKASGRAIYENVLVKGKATTSGGAIGGRNGGQTGLICERRKRLSVY